MKPIRRTYNIARLKQENAYTIHEICERLDICKNTVRLWLKEGLATVDDRKPYLILGLVLKAFLKNRQAARKRTCKIDEFYCFRCRTPHRPWGGVIDVHIRTVKVINITGICEQCEGGISKAASIHKLPEIAKRLTIQTLHNPHIAESLPPGAGWYLNREHQT